MGRATYLEELTATYTNIADTMTDGARLAINVANIRAPFGVTFLAWDLGKAVADELELDEELPICWDRQHPSITQDYCLVFKA